MATALALRVALMGTPIVLVHIVLKEGKTPHNKITHDKHGKVESTASDSSKNPDEETDTSSSNALRSDVVEPPKASIPIYLESHHAN